MLRFSHWRLRIGLAAIAISGLFVALNHRAFLGYFQDDELDTLTWARTLGARDYLAAFASPLFDKYNFRPTGHLYFTLMGDGFGLHFAPWMTPIFVIHLLNGVLLYLLMRRLSIGPSQALAGATVFLTGAAAFDAYWKPMYVFDLLCATFSLASILLYSYGRWILSFLAFWLAYKAKELAVTLPLALALWEFWFGEKRFLRLAPFFAVSLSFGLQGFLLNPNRNRHNDYTFDLSLHALRQTVPFYARRFFLFRASGLALFALALVRDRRVWFGLAGMAILISILLFLPGRLFEAYVYLPFAFAAIALAAAASHVSPWCAWAAVAVWMPFNIHQVNRAAEVKLASDVRIEAFVDAIRSWSAAHSGPDTLVYDRLPDASFHHWGVTAAWNLMHEKSGLPALWAEWPEAKKLLAERTVVWGAWDGKRLSLGVHEPPAHGTLSK